MLEVVPTAICWEPVQTSPVTQNPSANWLKEALKIGFDGVGIYEDFVHVDCRDGGTNPNYYRW